MELYTWMILQRFAKSLLVIYFFYRQFMILFLALLLPDHSCQNWPYPQNIMKDKDLIFFNKITCIRRLLSICQLSYF
jgi:hypothetical protein